MPPSFAGSDQVNPMIEFVVILGSFSKVCGASGTNTIRPPLPGGEIAESP